MKYRHSPVWVGGSWEEENGSNKEQRQQRPKSRASLVAQWLRIRLSMQGTQVRALVRKIPRAVEQLSPCATTTEPAL